MKKPITDAGQILRRRYVRDDPAREAEVQAERVNADVAQMIYDRRNAAGLTQKELAEMIGTHQSVISRLESADYDGHSLSMLERIGNALDQRIKVRMEPRDPEIKVIHFVFREVVAALRKRKGLTVDDLARKLGIDRVDIIAMERDDAYQPEPFVLFQLSQFHGIPQRQLAALAGAVTESSPALREQASRFAAQSESFSKLTRDERRTLDEFVKFLKSDEAKPAQH
jgi:transcriptional regulator with XRE-family HTH domain